MLKIKCHTRQTLFSHTQVSLMCCLKVGNILKIHSRKYEQFRMFKFRFSWWSIKSCIKTIIWLLYDCLPFDILLIYRKMQARICSCKVITNITNSNNNTAVSSHLLSVSIHLYLRDSSQHQISFHWMHSFCDCVVIYPSNHIARLY